MRFACIGLSILALLSVSGDLWATPVDDGIIQKKTESMPDTQPRINWKKSQNYSDLSLRELLDRWVKQEKKINDGEGLHMNKEVADKTLNSLKDDRRELERLLDQHSAEDYIKILYNPDDQAEEDLESSLGIPTNVHASSIVSNPAQFRNAYYFLTEADLPSQIIAQIRLTKKFPSGVREPVGFLSVNCPAQIIAKNFNCPEPYEFNPPKHVLYVNPEVPYRELLEAQDSQIGRPTAELVMTTQSKINGFGPVSLQECPPNREGLVSNVVDPGSVGQVQFNPNTLEPIGGGYGEPPMSEPMPTPDQTLSELMGMIRSEYPGIQLPPLEEFRNRIVSKLEMKRDKFIEHPDSPLFAQLQQVIENILSDQFKGAFFMMDDENETFKIMLKSRESQQSYFFFEEVSFPDLYLINQFKNPKPYQRGN